MLSIAHADGELAVARAAAATGVPLILSSAASHSIEEVAEAMGDAPRWFQLYWVYDREIVASFVDRAEAAGYAAIVVTLDTLDARLAAARPPQRLPAVRHRRGLRAVLQRPRLPRRLAQPPEEDVLAAAARCSRPSRTSR